MPVVAHERPARLVIQAVIWCIKNSQLRCKTNNTVLNLNQIWSAVKKSALFLSNMQMFSFRIIVVIRMSFEFWYD